jgi:(p)ppGpp synthase/HD superfamily hydrolase
MAIEKEEGLLFFQALAIATIAHEGQRRKYTDEPYIVHPLAVWAIVVGVTDDDEMAAAALLHDVIEDTSVTTYQLEYFFSDRVVQLVRELTDVSKPEDGNRKFRKDMDRKHTAKASPDAKTVKLADLIDNSHSILEHDEHFAKVYMREKAALLEVLKEGDETLYRRAKEIVDNYFGGEE